MNQTKNNNVDAARAENKRERRRVPSGRAAVLRRAPSDSDCSGETASLSADSGDRVVRPAPPPPRQNKPRRLHISANSRRRGSEWEVLEGLKDGQRFEKRPDVFNGYLHKKRKWPLKGWHKRFFVVDGGILVYARSPADVARGRLHGSVDVGLSVISAKARRRRIDIDADEFIYHLRAKTPDLFRTWLNVLKAHRLYRQHLLTFGARESVPKIHAPSDELPATDTSSHTSVASSETSVVTMNESESPSPALNNVCKYNSSLYTPKVQNSIFNWQQECYKGSLEPIDRPLAEQMFDIKFDHAIYKNRSLCSMHCVERNNGDMKRKKSVHLSMNSGDGEKQTICTDLDLNSLRNSSPETVSTKKQSNLNGSVDPNALPPKQSLFINKLSPPPTTCFFFTRKKPFDDWDIMSDMKKSNKCTNLVKYKNLASEPPLKMPPSKCMLLGKFKVKNGKATDKAEIETEPFVTENKSVHACEIYKQDSSQIVQNIEQKDVSAQNVISENEYDLITEQLMVSVFHKQSNGDDADDIRLCVDNIVKDLYDVTMDKSLNPVKALFRALLEYWLKNTSLVNVKDAVRAEKSVDRQSNKHFTRDEYLSTLVCNTMCKEKETQVHEIAHVKRVAKTPPIKREVPPLKYSPIRDTECFEKERRIQELEKLLKSTVYICETPRSQCREKDIHITKKLIDNLSKISRKSEIERREKDHSRDKKSRKTDIEKGGKGNLCKMSKQAEIKSRQKTALENSESSTELPEIQETINHLISDTAIPAGFAKDFLRAYLDVLLNEGMPDSSQSHSSWSGPSVKDVPVCEVLTEAVVKKVSKSMATFHPKKEPEKSKVSAKQPESGQVCIKDVLEKITTIFSRVKKNDPDTSDKNKQVPKPIEKKVIPTKDKLPVQHNTPGTNVATKDKLATYHNALATNSKHNLIYKNSRETSLIIDLANYSVEHISTSNNPFVKGVMSISIKVKEKCNVESNQTQLNMKFVDEVNPIVTPVDNSENWANFINDDSRLFFNKLPKNLNHTFVPDDTNNEMADNVKPYSSSSEATSKACRDQRVSEYSLDPSFQSNDSIKVIKHKKDDSHPCYLMSIKKGSLSSFKKKNKITEKSARPKSKSPSKLPTKTRITLESKLPKPVLRAASKPPSDVASVRSASPELSVFEKPAPRIIDEKFILLLLEHLMILSKSVPSLFKDINSLYIKLKKKHEKVLRNCNNIQGLSLLGKIYNESFVTGNCNKTTHIDSDLSLEVRHCTSKCCSTHAIDVENKEVGTVSSEKSSKHINTQTKNQDLIKQMRPMIHEATASSSLYDRIAVIPRESYIDQATAVPSWIDNKITDTAMETFIKRVLNENSNLAYGKSINHRGYITKRRNSPSVKQELVKWMLSPSIKESDQTTNRRVIESTNRRVIEQKKERFNVYQLFCSQKFELQRSSSLTVATQDSRSDGMMTVYRCSSDPSYASGLVSPGSPPLRGPQAGFVSGTPGGRLAGWIIESGGPLDNVTRELGQAQLSVQQLQRLLDALELQQQVHHDTDVSLEGASPSVKKDRRKFGLRKKKSNSKCASVELAPPHIDPSSSHTALSALTAPPSPGGGASSIPNSAASLPIACAAARPQSLPSAESMVTIQAGPASLTSLTPDHQLREDFTILAKDLVSSLKGIVSTMVCERSRLRAAMEAVDNPTIPNNSSMAALRTNLSTALQQNSELRSRLSRIHDASDIAEMNEASQRAFQQSLSYSSSCVSASEFFDAEEHEDDLKPEIDIPADEAGVIELDGDSSSEAGSLSSEEDVDAGSASSDNSEGAMLSAEAVTLRHDDVPTWTRRTRLPTPRPAPGGPSLWNLLYKNIGKDLSQISMPVTINEPTNMLQRLCEELEYSELLDSAAECNSALERMSLIAAFAVSAYAASAHRAASKPFNPLLHETYECIRDDRGFRFLAEQVSHHPPISACHAESPRWCFWQEARIKTKFWGKSMEFQPTGRVHVKLNTTGDHYTWNKVTTCVHNLFGGQRWVDQYGDMHIACVGTDISCKLNFIKASSWSQSRHEVRGVITMGRGTRLRLQGRWSEALYAGDPPAARCLWRPGAMPPDHELYYGFTRFAMELNELEPGMREILPHTDTRLRPDQRALEEGLVDSAEQLKHELEQSQRERRRDSLQHTPAWFRKTVEDGEETWVFSGEYWKARAAGFSPDCAPRIW